MTAEGIKVAADGAPWSSMPTSLTRTAAAAPLVDHQTAALPAVRPRPPPADQRLLPIAISRASCPSDHQSLTWPRQPSFPAGLMAAWPPGGSRRHRSRCTSFKCSFYGVWTRQHRVVPGQSMAGRGRLGGRPTPQSPPYHGQVKPEIHST